MRGWFLVVPLLFLPTTAAADFLDDIHPPLANDRFMAAPQALAPRVLTPLIAPTATPPMGLYSPAGGETQKMQVMPMPAPPTAIAPPTIMQKPVAPLLSQPIPIEGPGNNSCALAFNNVCDEPEPCAARTDSHDCTMKPGQ